VKVATRVELAVLTELLFIEALVLVVPVFTDADAVDTKIDVVAESVLVGAVNPVAVVLDTLVGLFNPEAAELVSSSRYTDEAYLSPHVCVALPVHGFVQKLSGLNRAEP
jgi:hypothetical protein